MTDQNGELAALRQYLLDMLNDEPVHRRIEERLFTDETFAEQIFIAENDLIEDFLDENLEPDETYQFLQFFLTSPERRFELNLIKDLRELSPRTESAARTYRGKFAVLVPDISMQSFRFAIIGLVLLMAGVIVWRFVVYRSDTESGLALLRSVYQTQRPLRARITALPDYAPFSETRGEGAEPSSPSIRERAQRHLLDASANTSDAAAHHGLGLYYLIERDFEKAQRELQAAVSLAPNDARIQSDIGVAYLERAKDSVSHGEGPTILELLNESIKHFDLAISLDPRLPEPYFGRGLCLQELANFEEAKAAWQRYLEIDSNSRWADEARQNLQKLEEFPVGERSAAELASDFVAASQKEDAKTAGRIIAANREPIREKYIPLRLAMEITRALPESRGDPLAALQFSGVIEMKLTGDPFASEIARFYLSLSESKIGKLRGAHENLRLGYKSCLDQDFASALVVFGLAKAQFDQTGNIWESKIAQYFLGYALINSDQNIEGIEELIKVSRFANERGFPWLDATAQYWIGGGYVKSQQHTKARRAFAGALSLAEKINDPYALQRNLLELANRHSFTGQYRESLKYMRRALAESARSETSQRQRYRTLVDAFTILSAANLFDAARPMALEAVSVADRLDDAVWKSQSRGFAAIANARVRNFVKARKWLEESKMSAASIGNEGARSRVNAFSDLRLGEIERYEGNFEAAERHFAEAVRYYDSVDMPLNREEAHNGLLLTYLALGRTAELEQQIPLNILIAEDYRSSIKEESQRSSFLGSRSDIYEIATAFEFNRGNIERAYEYSEMSSSRSLLDWITKGTSIAGVRSNPQDLMLNAVTSPSSLKQIREQMSDDVQIIQYSVLDDKILIWVISKKNFIAREVRVSRSELDIKVTEFRRSIIAREEFEGINVIRLGRDLYDLLIGSIRADLDPTIEVCIVPSKSLYKLPFSALRSPEGGSLIAELKLLFAPSASVFLHSSNRAARKSAFREESILAVGNPQFERDSFNDLPSLPDAEDEASDVSRNYKNARILLNKNAEKSEFLTALPTAEVVHFAGHYVAVAGVPSSSYLLMATDEPDPDASSITNRELAQLNFPVLKLIVLSACQTGVETFDDHGEGMIGLSRTMLAVDSPLVVGSNWAVDSTSTALIMRRFHYLRKHEQLASTEALRRAQLELMNDPTGRFNAPYYWAAFAVFGGHANF